MSKLVLSLSKETAKEIIQFAKIIKKLKPFANTLGFAIFDTNYKKIVLHSNGMFEELNSNILEISKCFACNEIKFPENKNSNQQDYEINIDDFIVNIKEEDGVYTLPINNGFELPELIVKELESNNIINLNISKLNNISKFASKDIWRPNLKTVNIDILNHKIDICATDGIKLVYINEKSNDSDLSLLIPANVIELFNKFKIKNDLFKINIYKNHISMHGSNMEIIYSKIDEKFPNFHEVIPNIEENYSNIFLPIGKIKQLLPSIKNILSIKGTNPEFIIKESKYFANYKNDNNDKIEVELGNIDYGISPITHHFDLKIIYDVFNYIISCGKFDEPKLHVSTIKTGKATVITFSNELLIVMPIMNFEI